MKFKQLISSATVIATITSMSGFTSFAADAIPATTAFTEGTVNAYVYSTENVQKVDCRFYADMPSIPYVRFSDYYKLWLDQNVEIKNNYDGTYSIKVPYGSTGIIDVQKDHLSADSPEFFMPESAFTNESIYARLFIKSDKSEDSITGSRTEIDFNRYNIDIYGDDTDIWFPVPTLCDIFTKDDKESFYSEEELYFCSDRSNEFSMENILFSDEHISSYIEQYRNGRPEDLAEYNYNELCLSFDFTYGFPREIPFGSLLEEKGLDGMLSEGSDNTKKVKELLLSTDLTEYNFGLNFLNAYLDDGGHTSFIPLCFFSEDYFPILDEVYPTIDISLEDDGIGGSYEDTSSVITAIYDAEEAMIAAADKVVELSESVYYEKGDTAVFSFSAFMPNVEKWYSYYNENGEMPEDIITDFYKAIVMADENPDIKKFVLDLGTNMGGLSEAAEYMIAVMDNISTSYFKVYGTDETIELNCTVDKNLDKSFDEKDIAFDPDLQYAVLTTGISFSCANMFASLARDNNILLIGEQSGGGACASFLRTTADGGIYSLSSSISIVDKNGNNIDLGIKPDYEMVKLNESGNKDFTDVYNFENISKAIDEFYGNAKVDGTVTETAAASVTSAANTAVTATTTTQTAPATTTESTTSAAAATTSDNKNQGNASELPQTGNNSTRALSAVAFALTLITIGAAVMYVSTVSHKKETEGN